MSHACHETTYYKRIYLFPRLISGVWSGGTFQQSFGLSMRRGGRGAHAQTSWLMGACTMCKSGEKELYETLIALIFKIQTLLDAFVPTLDTTTVALVLHASPQFFDFHPRFHTIDTFPLSAKSLSSCLKSPNTVGRHHKHAPPQKVR